MSPYLKSWPKYLREGDSGPPVQWLQRRLKEQGFFKGTPLGNFGPLTRNALFYFQSTHLGRAGQPLEVDGLFGPESRWALLHPSGAAQRSHLGGDHIIPGRLAGPRLDFLRACAADYRSGQFVEIPDGSNWGPRLSQFLRRPDPWCAFWVSDAWQRQFGGYPNGTNHGHCLTWWREAGRLGQQIPRDREPPLPGDLMLMLFRNASGNLTGSGHIAVVTRVAADGSRFNTLGGNEGNRIKHGARQRAQATIAGWIDLFGDDRRSLRFDPGVIAASASATSLQATR